MHREPRALGPTPPAEAVPAPAGRVVRGVLHVHSHLSHDSRGSFERIAAMARHTGVEFVALCDHHEPDTFERSPRGELYGVIFLPGVETKGGRGSVLGIDLQAPLEEPVPRGPAQELIDKIEAAGGLSFIGHAERFRTWDEVEGFTGLEVANLHAMASAAPYLGTGAAALFATPGPFLRRLVRHGPRSPLRRWDELGQTRRVPGFGGCDAHENIRILGAAIGSYGETFRALNNHLIVREPGADGIREALAAGRGFVAFELRGSAEGFRYALLDAEGARLADMGEELPWRPGLTLAVQAPGNAELRLLRDGEVIAAATRALRLAPPGPGVYRVEAWIGRDPFILSNPIYLR